MGADDSGKYHAKRSESEFVVVKVAVVMKVVINVVMIVIFKMKW